MYHLQVSWWRRPKVAESIGGQAPDRPAAGVDHAYVIALRDGLDRALRQLTANQRAVLVLRFFEDRSERETAELLGVNIGTVKSQTSKAIRRLRTVAPELSEFASMHRSDR